MSHPYYYEYEPLRKICIQILRHEKLKYGNNDNTVYGLLFDGAWLFEEYLFTILKQIDFKHCENKTGKNPFYLLKNNKWKIYPDFYKLENDNNIVFDAKYKNLDNKNKEDNEYINREDRLQIVSYAYTLNAKKAGFIYPIENDNCKGNTHIGNLNKKYNNIDCEINKYALKIPSKKDNNNFENIKDFSDSIEKSEKELLEQIKDGK